MTSSMDMILHMQHKMLIQPCSCPGRFNSRKEVRCKSGSFQSQSLPNEEDKHSLILYLHVSESVNTSSLPAYLGFPDFQQIKPLAFILSTKGWTFRKVEHTF